MNFNRANTEEEFKKTLFSKLKLIRIIDDYYDETLYILCCKEVYKEERFLFSYNNERKSFSVSWSSTNNNNNINTIHETIEAIILRKIGIPYIINHTKKEQREYLTLFLEKKYVDLNGYELS